ncbi:solute carrier family 23 protein [Geobacillus proteiniphilus]|uniref:Solute carrier family 23 protein n=1 Tax=Geobacillus proteiniphilus TaxID=860353 RepID=A0A1Q5SWN0_9BACL|nr:MULTISPECIES: solute carrier family 23 protein [Geobacillus]OKO92342.1 Xanthine permease [Geobacillus proteiniphilus]OPX00880.1 hypothetical protein B1A75_17210 [Geobacillus sp. LEMMY01]WMJ15268.1 solute carrier family 23 protein [Geobacillus proteiniphilus]
MKMKWWQVGSLGIQHVLAMYAGAIVVPLIVGGALHLTSEQLTYLVAIDLLTCGIATFLQAWKNKWFGIGLPVMLGCTFTAVGPMIAIGGQYGMPAVYGAILCAGAVVVLISPYFGKLRALFPPVVTGSVVTVIGLTLIPAAVLGGAMIAMFGTVVAYGVKMLSQVDLTSQENLLIIACSVGVGLGVTVVPNLFAELPAGLRILTDSGIVVGSMTAIILNAVFHFGKARKSAALPLQEQKIS